MGRSVIDFRSCKNCGNQFEVTHAWTRKKFCNHKCSTDFMRGKPKSEDHRRKIKENHAKYWASNEMSEEHRKKIGERSKGNKYAYKNGTTPELRRVRNSVEMLQWKKKVYAKNGFKCQACGSGKNLHAHHIKAFAKFPDLRFVLDNGITLCKDCHKRTHDLERNQRDLPPEIVKAIDDHFWELI